MKFFIVAVAALLTLSACNAPQSDENEDDRTEQGAQEDEDD
jgi:protein involved in sex pheromone biosynthesis